MFEIIKNILATIGASCIACTGFVVAYVLSVAKSDSEKEEVE